MTDVINTIFGLLLSFLAIAGIQSDKILVEPERGQQERAMPGVPSPDLELDKESLQDSIQSFVDELMATAEQDKAQIGPNPDSDNDDKGCVTERESGNGWSRTVTRCVNEEQSKDGASRSSNRVIISSSSSTGP